MFWKDFLKKSQQTTTGHEKLLSLQIVKSGAKFENSGKYDFFAIILMKAVLPGSLLLFNFKGIMKLKPNH